MTSGAKESFRKHVVGRARHVAVATGGILGLGNKISDAEKAKLHELEEAIGYQQLIEEHQYSQGELAEVIGKSRPHISNTLRLLKLPHEVQTYLRDGKLTAGNKGVEAGLAALEMVSLLSAMEA